MICGTCGTIACDIESGFCENGHDNWIEAEDFLDESLQAHLKSVASNISMTYDDMRRVCMEAYNNQIEIGDINLPDGRVLTLIWNEKTKLYWLKYPEDLPITFDAIK